MKKELIRDNGKIRNCTSNIYKMSFLHVMIYDLKYLFPSDMLDIFKEFIKSIGIFLWCILFFILFPVFIFIRTYKKKEKAKKEMFEFRKRDA